MNKRRPTESLTIRFVCGLFFVLAGGLSSLNADTFVAHLDATQVTGSSTETGTAVATFVLDAAQQNLRYSIAIFDMDLKPVPAERTLFSDVTAIHLHNGFAGSSGPHVLNIFGIPSEDDAEMVVDFANETIEGIYNDVDAVNPETGELFDQNSAITTKLLSNFSDDLIGEQLYLAIHTAGQGGGVAIRGQLVAVPEPSALAFIFASGVFCLVRRVRS